MLLVSSHSHIISRGWFSYSLHIVQACLLTFSYHLSLALTWHLAPLLIFTLHTDCKKNMAFSLTALTPSMPHTTPFHLFEIEVTIRNLHTWWSICPNASSDQVLFFLDDTSCQFFATIMASDHSNTHSSVQLKYNTSTFSNRHITFLFFLTLGPSSAQTSPFYTQLKHTGNN
jgi:hypothetical protein